MISHGILEDIIALYDHYGIHYIKRYKGRWIVCVEHNERMVRSRPTVELGTAIMQTVRDAKHFEVADAGKMKLIDMLHRGEILPSDIRYALGQCDGDRFSK